MMVGQNQRRRQPAGARVRVWLAAWLLVSLVAVGIDMPRSRTAAEDAADSDAGAKQNLAPADLGTSSGLKVPRGSVPRPAMPRGPGRTAAPDSPARCGERIPLIPRAGGPEFPEQGATRSRSNPEGPDPQHISDSALAEPLLTERQLDVLCSMAEGLSNQQIASRLVLRLETVKTHTSRIYKALQARDRPHAVAIGFRIGLLAFEQPQAPAPCRGAGGTDGLNLKVGTGWRH